MVLTWGRFYAKAKGRKVELEKSTGVCMLQEVQSNSERKSYALHDTTYYWYEPQKNHRNTADLIGTVTSKTLFEDQCGEDVKLGERSTSSVSLALPLVIRLG